MDRFARTLTPSMKHPGYDPELELVVVYPGNGGRSGMMLMRWDVSLDLKTSRDGAHFMFLGMAFHSFGPRTAKAWS